MKLDTARFEKLLADVATHAATVRGFNEVITRTQEQRDRAAADLEHFEAAIRTTPLAAPPPPLPGAELSAEAAPMLDTMDRREAQFTAARSEVKRLTNEVRRLDAAQAEVFGRLNRLRTLERNCRAWATQHGITLPGNPQGPSGARVQSAPPGARQFGQHAESSSSATSAGPMAPQALAATQRGVFERLRRSVLP